LNEKLGVIMMMTFAGSPQSVSSAGKARKPKFRKTEGCTVAVKIGYGHITTWEWEFMAEGIPGWVRIGEIYEVAVKCVATGHDDQHQGTY
jgi:hypothetical protein